LDVKVGVCDDTDDVVAVIDADEVPQAQRAEHLKGALNGRVHVNGKGRGVEIRPEVDKMALQRLRKR
jgi:predicted N-acetyltransferase YhbS